jgi:hypothetical protein
MQTATPPYRLIACLLLAVAATGPAARGEAMLGPQAGSNHGKPGFCNFHPGIQFRWDNGVQFGAYRNSQCRASLYAGWSIEAGGDGYRGKGVKPAPSPSIAVSITQQQSLRFGYVPKTHPKSAAAFQMVIEHRF